MRILISPIISREGVYMWNHFSSPEVSSIAPNEAVRGQGLFSTRW